MKSKLINALLWALRKLGYNVPVIKPIVVEYKDLQRVRCQELLPYGTLDCKYAGHGAIVERALKERLAAKIMELVEVRVEVTPDGMKYLADILMTNYPKPDEGQVI